MPSKLVWYLYQKSNVVTFLITILILPRFPEQIVCNAHYFQKQHPQQWIPKTRYYSNYSSNGIPAHIMKGYTRRIQPSPHPTSLMALSPPPHYRPMPPTQKLRNISHSHHQHGMVTLQEVPSLPLPLLGRTAYRPRSPSKRKQSTDYPVAMKNTCMGRKNLIDDIGVLSLLTAVMSSSFGMYTILVNSMTSNNIGIVSGFMSLLLWVPSTLITLFNLSGDFVYYLSNLLNSISFVNSMYGFMGVFFGTADVLASTAGESVGIFSFILSVIATFPEFLDGIIEYLYRVGDRRKLEHFVDNYGCSVPRIFNYFGKPFYDVLNDFFVQAIGGKGRD